MGSYSISFLGETVSCDPEGDVCAVSVDYTAHFWGIESDHVLLPATVSVGGRSADGPTLKVHTMASDGHFAASLTADHGQGRGTVAEIDCEEERFALSVSCSDGENSYSVSVINTSAGTLTYLGYGFGIQPELGPSPHGYYVTYVGISLMGSTPVAFGITFSDGEIGVGVDYNFDTGVVTLRISIASYEFKDLSVNEVSFEGSFIPGNSGGTMTASVLVEGLHKVDDPDFFVNDLSASAVFAEGMVSSFTLGIGYAYDDGHRIADEFEVSVSKGPDGGVSSSGYANIEYTDASPLSIAGVTITGTAKAVAEGAQVRLSFADGLEGAIDIDAGSGQKASFGFGGSVRTEIGGLSFDSISLSYSTGGSIA